MGSGPQLSPDRQGKGAENRRCGSPEVREHRAHFWRGAGRGEKELEEP